MTKIRLRFFGQSCQCISRKCNTFLYNLSRHNTTWTMALQADLPRKELNLTWNKNWFLSWGGLVISAPSLMSFSLCVTYIFFVKATMREISVFCDCWLEVKKCADTLFTKRNAHLLDLWSSSPTKYRKYGKYGKLYGKYGIYEKYRK